MKSNLSSFYDDCDRLMYHPQLGYSKRNFIKRLIAFDDRFETVKKELEELIRKKSTSLVKVLDIGVGDGIYEAILDENIRDRCQFYGIDVSPTQLQRAKKYLKEAKVVDLNTQKLPYKNNFFDIIIASEILEHLFTPEKVLYDAQRVLKKGGYLLVTIPNASSLQLRLAIFLAGYSPLLNYPTNKEHIRFFTTSDIKKMINKNLEIIKVQGLGSFLFEKWNFFAKVPMPRLIEIFGNKLLTGLALGNLLILQKK